MYIILLYYVLLIAAPSFSSDIVLKQVSSNPSSNTITVSLPIFDESAGPIRYIHVFIHCSHSAYGLYMYVILLMHA